MFKNMGTSGNIVISLNSNVLRCRYLCKRTKTKPSQDLVLPVLLYGRETRMVGARECGHLNFVNTRIIRRIMGYRWNNFVFRNRVLREAGVPRRVSSLVVIVVVELSMEKRKTKNSK